MRIPCLIGRCLTVVVGGLALLLLGSCGSGSKQDAIPFSGTREYRLPAVTGAGFTSVDLTIAVTHSTATGRAVPSDVSVKLTSTDHRFNQTAATVTAVSTNHIEANAKTTDQQTVELELDFTDGGSQLEANLRSGSSLVAASGSNITVPANGRGDYLLVGWNDLGMHCMNEDFSSLMILPPFNTLHAQVVKRSGEDPQIVTAGVTISYAVPGNTKSSTKTNFWQYSKGLLGTAITPDVGLTGSKLTGTLAATGANDWAVTGIPLTPKTDAGTINAYQLASLKLTVGGQQVAATQAVVPVSWEISCNLCHKTAGISTDVDILRKHDRKFKTTLEQQRPVNCAKCHAELNLGTTGTAGTKSLSAAMHGSHATRMAAAKLTNECYACHPGVQTNCQRDVHKAKGITCKNCHISMAAVGNTARRPWIDEPRCGSAGCHTRAGFEFEQANTRFRDSKGHHGIRCPVCHSSPHAIAPATTTADNAQAIALQGHAGTLNTCTLCHKQAPDDPFDHRFSTSD